MSVQVGVHETLEHLRRRELAHRESGRARAEQLRRRLPEAAASLRARGARRIGVFGSLVQGTPSPDCDVDLAVEGLPHEVYFEALAELIRLLGAVDLVRMEEAPDSLRDRIDAEAQWL